MIKMPLIAGLEREDHRTYIVSPRNEIGFLEYWEKKGFKVASVIKTKKFPARHIVLLKDASVEKTYQEMVGLSVSDDPSSPINKSVYLYGDARVEDGKIVPGRVQHIAYSLDRKLWMSEIMEKLEKKNIRFMTPILSYTDSNDAVLRQMFVACEKPYGEFIEIVQRGVGNDGSPFKGFNSEQIDQLYKYYDSFSEILIGRKT